MKAGIMKKLILLTVMLFSSQEVLAICIADYQCRMSACDYRTNQCPSTSKLETFTVIPGDPWSNTRLYLAEPNAWNKQYILHVLGSPEVICNGTSRYNAGNVRCPNKEEMENQKLSVVVVDGSDVIGLFYASYLYKNIDFEVAADSQPYRSIKVSCRQVSGCAQKQLE